MSEPISIWVPSEVWKGHGVLPGSAIVGELHYDMGRIVLDYEGNRYDAINMRRFVERCYQAWSRHVEHYPTVARVYVLSAEVTMVGEFDPDTKRVTVNPLDAPKLAAWLGMDTIPEQELVL